MQNALFLSFGPYRLDLNDERLWRGKRVVRLTGKAFQVLWQLMERPQQLVTKEDIFAAVWPETAVSDAALTSCIHELRRALHDDPKRPTYIATVHRRGFRFLKAVQRPQAESGLASPPSRISPAPHIVGRQAELDQLHGWLACALHGERQVVFVTGEPGIGKTTVVAALVARLAGDEHVWIGQGQCIEHYGAGEAYRPVLEALGRLSRSPQGERLVALLRHYAPSWLIQMPTLLDAAELEALQRAVTGTTQARMLREMTEALESITAEIPLVLILEDLQWADYSTVELLAALARRRERARLLVLATYRPVDVLVGEHPLHRVQQELQWHGQCQELALAFLSQTAVDDYLAERFVSGAAPALSPPGLASFIHRWTEGNPLFMVALVDELIQQRILGEVEGEWILHRPIKDIEVAAPASVQHLMEHQIAQLSLAEREILEAASVAGVTFSAAVLAMTCDSAAEAVEAVCEALARRAQFVQATGTSEWPDGTVSARYGFIHALYQEIVYAWVPAGRRVRLHQQIGKQLEGSYGEQASTIAAELGMHFELGHDYTRAVQYWRQAGSRAAARSAYHEAVSCFEQALSALGHLAECRDTLEQAIDLRLDLRNALHPLGEQGQVGDHLRDAEVLAERLGDEQRRGQIACCLCIHLSNVEAYDRAIAAGQRALALGKTSGAFDVQVVAQSLLGAVYCHVGDFRQALESSRRAKTLLTGEQCFAHFGQVALPAVTSRGFMLWSLAELGDFAEGHSVAEEALRLAEAIEQPYSIALALSCVGLLSRRQGVLHMAISTLQRGVALCQTANIAHLFPQIASILGTMYVYAGRIPEALPLLNQALERVTIGSRMLNLGLVLTELSEAVLLVGRVEEASVLAERLDELSRTHTRHSFQAHAGRLLGEVAMRRDLPEVDLAEVHYQQALTLAEELGMRPLQAHCYRGLGMLYGQTGRSEQAHAALSTAIEMYHDMEMMFWLPQAQEMLVTVQRVSNRMATDN